MWNSALHHPQYFPLPNHEKQCIRFALKAAYRVSTAESHLLLSTANHEIPAVAFDHPLMLHFVIVKLASYGCLQKSVIGKTKGILTVISERKRTTAKKLSGRSSMA